jgi:hypothetical protein
VKYNQGTGETMIAKKLQVEMNWPGRRPFSVSSSEPKSKRKLAPNERI